jgi:hypothetical protein
MSLAGVGILLLVCSLPLAAMALASFAIVVAARKLSPFERALMSIALWTGALSVVMLIAGLALYLIGRVR